jgi:hypothetical protein
VGLVIYEEPRLCVFRLVSMCYIVITILRLNETGEAYRVKIPKHLECFCSNRKYN